MFEPSYICLYKSGELKKRVRDLEACLAECEICPRRCHVDRTESKTGFCRSGKLVSVSSYCPHHGEEPALSGTRGSGTIFFSRCNLKCIYCQNHQISQGNDLECTDINGNDLAGIMLHLQYDLGCHNINLVSPSHFVPQIVEAVCLAVPMGLNIPIVYNTNAYDSMLALKMLEDIVDIYLPDIKYASDKWAEKLSGCKNYVTVSRTAIHEMYRQVGDLITDDSGLAQRGLIVRHLILPNNLAGSHDSLEWLATNISDNVTVSIMAQYHPCHLAVNESLLSRRITLSEYENVVRLVEGLQLSNGWLQEMDSADFYLPDFKRDGHPFSIA